MSRRNPDEDLIVAYGVLFILLAVVPFFIGDGSGWGWAAAWEAGVVSVLFGLYSIWRRSERKREERRRTASCKHGVAVALYGEKPCAACERELSAEKMAARRAIEESRQRRRAERARSFREQRSQMRLADGLKAMHPKEFEHLICELFRRMGYQVEVTRYVGDSGVDAYLRKDGVLSILQSKRFKGVVGEPVLRDLFGTMHAEGATRGVLVTTGRVSAPAREWARGKPIKLIELHDLLALVRDHFPADEAMPWEFGEFGEFGGHHT